MSDNTQTGGGNSPSVAQMVGSHWLRIQQTTTEIAKSADVVFVRRAAIRILTSLEQIELLREMESWRN
jgi:hypothetical protein